MASPTQWTWVWVNSRSRWWTRRPGVLPSWGRRVGHDWATELNWTILLSQCSSSICPLGPTPSSLRKDSTTIVWYFPSESPRFLPLPDHFPSAFKSADRILTEKDRSLSGPNYFFLHIHISILWQILFPFSLLCNTEQISLCCTVGPCWLSVLNIAVCTCQSQIS